MQPQDYYLQLLGIERWQLRDNTVRDLIYVQSTPTAQWLFILEKQEALQDSPLLHAILAALKQTPDSIALAYYDEALERQSIRQALPGLCYVVALGEFPAQQLHAAGVRQIEKISVMIGANLATLSHDIQAKRQLWTQLKQT